MANQLTYQEVLDLKQDIQHRMPDETTLILILLKLNMDGKLDAFLDLLQMSDLAKKGKRSPKARSNGKIVVFGDSQVKKKDLLGIAKTLGVAKNRIEFVDYEHAKTYPYRKLQFRDDVVAVMFGAIPHSNAGKGTYTSLVNLMEHNPDRYPEVIRLVSNKKMKITKTNFRKELEDLISAGKLDVA